MACRFPQANNPEEFWHILANGIDTISEPPEGRWEVEKFYDSSLKEGKMYTTKAGFIKDVETFDAQYFNISPQEATYMDPQQRLLLETTCEALEDAGIIIDKLKGSNTSVFVGEAVYDYTQRHLTEYNTSKASSYSITGSGPYSAAGRISYSLGLEGNSLVVSTACSSSLVALHLACTSLQTQESDMAIVGGANLIVSPEATVALCQMNALAKDGKSKSFDASADGYVRGEGVAVIIVKRLSDAIREQNNILAVIKSTFANQDGKSNGFTAPNSIAQQKMLKGALEKAKMSAKQISYIEAHGTGTPLGDPIELEALKTIHVNRKDSPLWVGTVKTNIGHTEGTAGLAGVIKVILSLQHKTIPPNLHFQTPNPFFDWDSVNFKVPTQPTEWQNDGAYPRAAGVSSFGISGTNAHAIIEEYEGGKSETIKVVQNKWFPDLLLISAKTHQALKIYVKSYIKYLQNNIQIDWASICANTALHRTHFTERLAISAPNKEKAIKLLEDFIEGGGRNNTLETDDKPKVVFVFPGQGSQWVGMGKMLYGESEIFQKTIDTCSKAFGKYLNWSITEELLKEQANRFDEIDVIQPVLIAMEIALAKLWQSVGIEPDAVVGHSMGETAAAYLSGALSLEDVGKIICLRSQLMKKLSGKGSMLLVELSVEQATQAIKGFEKQVSIAVSNSPQSTVLSGDTDAIQTIMTKLEQEGIFCRLVKVNVASHSPQMDELKPELLKVLENIKPQENKVAFYSTVKNQIISGIDLSPAYWVDNLREPVMFGDTVQTLLEDGHTVFIEMTPHPILLVQMQQIIQAGEWKAVAIPTVRRDKPTNEEFANSLAQLYMAGYPINWTAFYQQVSHLKLPTYPWQRKRYWLETSDIQVGEFQKNETIVEEETTIDKIEIHTFFKQKLAQVAGYSRNEITDDMKLAQMGIDSMMLTQIRKSIENTYQVSFSTKDFWKYPTIKQFVAFLQGLNNGTASESHHISNQNWFEKPTKRNQATTKIFCFHHAGGNAAMYHSWGKLLPDFVELIAVQLPGRAERMGEACYTDIKTLLNDLLPAILPELDKPYAFFGHSMGGVLAFALARELQAKGLPLPAHLFISASVYFPTFKGTKLHNLSDEILLSLFPDISIENFGGDKEFFDIVFKALRADLAVIGSFVHTESPALDIPLTVLSAREDIVAPIKDMQGWKKETTLTYQFIERDGKHDYIMQDSFFITQRIADALSQYATFQTQK
jgi:acyl transferase domain-containing protein/surfactin synthase thioesterase subunit